MLSNQKQNLLIAESNAQNLFKEIENRGLLTHGKYEKDLNSEIFDLALEMYGIKKYWHKRIVRSGVNTLKPYNENPENLLIEKDDILFIDFGPIFDEWEADFGRTYVLGNDKYKIKLKDDIELGWHDCKKYFKSHSKITGAELYDYAFESAKKYGWEFGGEIAGHLIGHFPHEKLDKEDKRNYVHPKNNIDMFQPDKSGNKRDWILEIHYVDKEKKIGGFFEQLLTAE
ncbi:MAG: aminopeptidase [Flammeovirgaceae bacterium]|nr:aminopeptidase [Flammeovirgaceae bacterium]